ncbi:MAG TPA: hypothetical protein VGM19_14570 [Armatimonadota bacterium]|jgi:hypothetical protein
MATPAVGSAVVKINPPLGSSVPGYFEDRKATGIHDDLQAHALVIAGEDPLAILSLDLIAVPHDMVLELRRQAQAELGIPGERLFVHATHTHTAGPTISAFLTKRDEDYLRQLVVWCGEALRQAQARATATELAFGSTQVPGLQFVRRYWMRDGSLRTNPGLGNPDVVRPAGEANSELNVVAFRSVCGPLTLLVNFALHPDTVGGTELSADYPYYLRQALQETLGADTVVLFLNGAAGDINHLDVLGSEAPAEFTHDLFMKVVRDEEFTPRAGRTLAAAVQELLPDLQYTADWTVDEAHETLLLPRRTPPPEQLARAHALLETHTPEQLTEAQDLYDYEALLLAETGETEAEVEIQALRLGTVALVGIPNEVFTELGQLLQSQSPFAHTLVVQLTNGAAGYLPTARAFAEGGYEIMLARSSMLTPEAGDTIVAQAVHVLHSLA